MPAPTYNVPVVGQPNSTEDPKIANALAALKTLLTAGIDNANIASSLLNLILQVVPTGTHKVNFGSTTMNFPFAAGSLYSQFVTINHGLAVVPAVIFVAVQSGDAFASVVGTPTAASFQALGKTPNGTTTGSAPLNWLAIS